MYSKRMRSFHSLVWACAWLLLPGGIGRSGAVEIPAGTKSASAAPVNFARDIRPIFEQNCISCHGPEKQKSSFRLDRRADFFKGGENGAVVEPGKSAGSALISRITSTDAGEVMPPKGERLNSEQIALLRAWVDQGAIWVESDAERAAARDKRLDHWAYQPVKRPALPVVKRKNWARNPIDVLTLAKLEQNQLPPSPEADRRTLVRRLSYDLLGLPPTPEQVEAFVADKRPDAYERLVESLLASPHYGERWARHWLDVVRFAETYGFEMNQPRKNAWPFRDYVIRAFNEDKPYNRFVLEQLAGDSVGVDEATGFIVAGPADQVKSPDPVLTANQRADELHDMVSTTGSAFLGLTVGCARCHSHKFDPISQTDYYALKACLAGVQHGERKFHTPENEALEQELAQGRKQLHEMEARLAQFEPKAATGRMVFVDDVASTVTSEGATVAELVPHVGKGTYAVGTGRGERDDAGDLGRSANFTDSYLAWNKVANKNVFAYAPHAAGRFRVWLSWGCGWHTHAKDARYLLDRDGDLTTTNDQVEIARVDQQKFADGTGELPDKPLWSGFYDAGVWDLSPNSRIVLRGGDTDAYVAADVIALQEVKGQPEDLVSGSFLRAPVHPRENSERFAPVVARRLRFTVTRTTDAEPCLDELEVYTVGSKPRNMALASSGTKATASSVYPNSEKHSLAHLNDGLYGNSYSWISNERGQGWVELEFPENITIDHVVWGRDREQKFSDRLALDYRIEVSTGTNEWALVASSADRQPYVAKRKPQSVYHTAGLNAEAQTQLKQLIAQHHQLEAHLKETGGGAMVYAGRFEEKPQPTYLLHRGDPMTPREAVLPGAIAELPGKFEVSDMTSDQQRRLALAKWIVAPENPLTARVMVNRLWQYHFGEGLVSTSSDFGINGARPSNPELLNWLAAEFIERGWSIKHIHRLIVTSATYRQTSGSRKDGLAVDAGSRLLWRFPARRLDAEAIRDKILAVSGKLDLSIGGPGFSFFEANENYVRLYNPKKSFGPEDWRRMVYGTVIRQRPDGVFGAFDCPDGGQIAPKRNRSTSPLQALNLLNSEFMLQQAHFLAERLEKDAGQNVEAQIQRAFALAFQRSAESEELAASKKLVQEQGLPIFCRALLNANEFVFQF